MADVTDETVITDEQSQETKALLNADEAGVDPAAKPATATEDDTIEDDKGKPAVESSDQINLEELQQQTREQAKTIATLEKTVERLNSILVSAKLVTEETPEEIEAATEAQKVRDNALATILEVMELNPQYADVKQVVTRKRFDDIVEQLAKVTVTKEGGRLVDHINTIEDQIWGMANPYKYMYGKIKEFHPDYQKTKPATDVATDIHDVPGGQQPTASGWTAAKIDKMPEDELDSVPKDVYEKYLRGELA